MAIRTRVRFCVLPPTVKRPGAAQNPGAVVAFLANVTARPFLYLAIAFFAGFVSQTFPVRLIVSVLMRLVSWLSGLAILVFSEGKEDQLFATGILLLVLASLLVSLFLVSL
jgi:hypothetical protein